MIGFGIFVFALVLVYLLYYTLLIVGDLNKKQGRKDAGPSSAGAGESSGGQGNDAEDESVEVTESEEGFELAGGGYGLAGETGATNSSGGSGADADAKQLSAEEEARAREEAEAQAQEETCEKLRDEIEEVQGNLEKKAHEFRLEGEMHDKELLKAVMQQFSQRGMKVQLGFRPEIENI